MNDDKKPDISLKNVLDRFQKLIYQNRREQWMSFEQPANQESIENALMHLFKAHPELLEWPVPNHEEGAAEFQSFFRKMDMTDSGDIDMAIWNLMYVSRLYWIAFEQEYDSCKD